MPRQQRHAICRLIAAILPLAGGAGVMVAAPFALADEAPRRRLEAASPPREAQGLHTATFVGGCFRRC